MTRWSSPLQPPFFHLLNHPAWNFGSMGSIMGHELTHGFDNNGRHYDSTGRVKNWWGSKARKAFLGRARCLIHFYKRYREGGRQIPALATLAENIADVGGVALAHDAMKSFIDDASPATRKHWPALPDGMSASQAFFVSYAQTWCTQPPPPAQAAALMNYDEHAPPRMRVNGPLANNPAFHEAFQCPKGSNMNPLEQCRTDLLS